MEACGIHETTYNSIIAMLTSGRTCTPTPSCPAAPPCTPVLPTGCRRRSPLLPHPPSRSRSSLPPSASTPSGSEDPSWPPCPPSSRCGSPNRSTTSPAPPSCTASASNKFELSKNKQQQQQNHQQRQQEQAEKFQHLRDDHKLFCNNNQNPLSHCSDNNVSCLWLILLLLLTTLTFFSLQPKF